MFYHGFVNQIEEHYQNDEVNAYFKLLPTTSMFRGDTIISFDIRA